jgi:hypothetical protein
MEIYGVEVKLHTFLTTPLGRSEWSTSRSIRFIPGERAPYSLDRRLDGRQSQSGRVGEEKYSCLCLESNPGGSARTSLTELIRCWVQWTRIIAGFLKKNFLCPVEMREDEGGHSKQTFLGRSILRFQDCQAGNCQYLVYLRQYRPTTHFLPTAELFTLYLFRNGSAKNSLKYFDSPAYV